MHSSPLTKNLEEAWRFPWFRSEKHNPRSKKSAKEKLMTFKSRTSHMNSF